jgi:uncharacterized protein involved in response to NO
MTTSSEQIRAWTGPAILSFGFRPFFLMAAIWAASAMGIWVVMLTGQDILPTAFDPVSWHSHELLFGYLAAVIAGFLLTAVPNWTGSLPLVGWPLAGLAALWVLGRVVVATSSYLTPMLAALGDLAFPVALAGFLAREIFAGRNWKNLPVLALLTAYTLANGLFHWEAAQDGTPAQEIGLRVGLAVAVLLISLIGGRIVPSFTRNWLAQRGAERLPVPFGRADGAVLALTLATLALWVVGPDRAITAVACGLAGLAHLWRLARWQGHQTGAEALVWVLHAGYAFVPLGFLGCGAGPVFPRPGPGGDACLDGGGGRPDDAGSHDAGEPWPRRAAPACYGGDHRALSRADRRGSGTPAGRCFARGKLATPSCCRGVDRGLWRVRRDLLADPCAPAKCSAALKQLGPGNATTIQFGHKTDKINPRMPHTLERTGRLGLSDRLDYLPANLSGGQKQRVAIGRALVGNPDVVLADEPTAALDWDTAAKVVDLLKQLGQARGTTTVMVTHDNRILDRADRILTLEDGRLVGDENRA